MPRAQKVMQTHLAEMNQSLLGEEWAPFRIFLVKQLSALQSRVEFCFVIESLAMELEAAKTLQQSKYLLVIRIIHINVVSELMI